MPDGNDIFKEFGGSEVKKEANPFSEFGGTELKKKVAPNAGEDTGSHSGNGSQPSYAIAPSSLKDISPNLSTSGGWFNGMFNASDNISPFEEAKTDAELARRVADYQHQYSDAVFMGDTPAAKPDQMLTGKEKQKLQEKDVYTYMKHDFLGNARYLSPLERNQYYAHIQSLLPKADINKIKQQGEEYAYQQSQYNVARQEMLKSPTPDNMYVVGNYQAANGDLTTAIKTFSKIVHDHPDNPKGYQGLAYTAYAHNNISQALKFIEQGLLQTQQVQQGTMGWEKQDAGLLTAKANYLWLSGKHSEAVEVINEAISNAGEGTKEKATAYQVRAAMRNANGNVPGATDDRQKGLQAYDTYNARFSYFEQGNAENPVEEKTNSKTEELTPAQYSLQQSEDAFKKLVQFETIHGLTSEETGTQTKYPASVSALGNATELYGTEKDKEIEKQHQELEQQASLWVNTQKQKERQDWLNKTQGIGFNAFIANPSQYVNEHIENTMNQIKEGIGNLGKGISSIKDNQFGFLVDPSQYRKMWLKSAATTLKGALEITSGVAGITPDGIEVTGAFEEIQQNNPQLYSWLTPGSTLYKDGKVSKDVGDITDNATQLAAIICFHKLYKATANYGKWTLKSDIVNNPPPLLNREPLNTEPLKNMTEQETANTQKEDVLLFKILSGEKPSDEDIAQTQSLVDMDKMSKELPDIAAKNTEQVQAIVEQAKGVAQNFIPKEAEKELPVKYTPLPTKANPEPKEESYSNKNGKWYNEEGKPIMSKPLIAQLNKLRIKPEPVKETRITIGEGNGSVPFTMEVNKPEIAKPVENLNSTVVNYPVSDINTKIGEYQNRAKEYSERSVKKITEGFDPNKLDPVVLYKDPNGKTYILSGHSRLEGSKRLNKETIPARFFEGTPEQAKEYARESNTLSDPETLVERANVYRELRQIGKKESDITSKAKNTEGKNHKDVIAISYLNPQGKTLNALNSLAGGGGDTEKDITKAAVWIGKAKEAIPELKLNHENELYDWLINKGNLRKIGNVEDFISRVQKVGDYIRMNPDEPLNMDERVTKGDAQQTVENEKAELLKEQKELIKEKTTSDSPKRQTEITTRLSEIDKNLSIINKRIRDAKEYDKLQRGLFDIGTSEYEVLNTVQNLYNGEETPLSDNGKLASDQYPMDWVDIRNKNISELPRETLKNLSDILQGEGTSINKQLEGNNGLRFMDALVKAGMLQETVSWRNNESLSHIGMQNMNDLVRDLVSSGIHGEAKEPFKDSFNKLPKDLQEDIKGHIFQILSSGVNSPLDVIQQAIISIAEKIPSEDEHVSAMTDMLPTGLHEFLKNYEINLLKYSKPEALDYSLSTDKGSTGVDEALKQIDHEKTKPATTDETHQPGNEGKEIEKPLGETPAHPEINDYTEPLPDDTKPDPDITLNANIGYKLFNAFLNFRNWIRRPELNDPRHTIENARRSETNGKRAEDMKRNKLVEYMFDKFLLTPEDNAAVDDFIDQQQTQDGQNRVLHKFAKQPLPKPSNAIPPEDWTASQKEHYRVINDLRKKALEWAKAAQKLMSDKLTPQTVQMMTETPNYLPRTSKEFSPVITELNERIKAARESAIAKDKGWTAVQADRINKLRDKTGSFIIREVKSLYKDRLTTKDIDDMLTLPVYYKAVGKEGSFVVKFNEKGGIIEKWQNKEPQKIGTYKGQQNKKGRIWVAKKPEPGKPDHFIFDDNDLVNGKSKRSIVMKASKETDFTKRTTLLKQAGLPSNFFDKFESKKNPNSTLTNIIHKTGKFIDAKGNEYYVLPETKKNIELNANEEYEKNPLKSALQLERTMYNIYKNTKYFHDIMNSASLKEITFSPDKQQQQVIENNKEENVKERLGIKDFTSEQGKDYEQAKKIAYIKNGIPEDFDDKWTTSRLTDGRNSVFPDMYKDIYFRKDHYRLLRGDMTRNPQDPSRMAMSIVNLWYTFKMTPFVHDWNIATNWIIQGFHPSLLGKAKTSFLTKNDFWKSAMEAGMFSVGDVQKGWADVAKSFLEYEEKNNPEYQELMKELEPEGISKALVETGKKGEQAITWTRKKMKALLWNVQNITLFNSLMGAMEQYGYKFPENMSDIDYDDPKYNEALIRGIDHIQRTTNTYFIGDKAFGLNNRVGQFLARMERTQLVTMFGAYRHGNMRVIKNMLSDIGGKSNIEKGRISPASNERNIRTKSGIKQAVLAGLGMGAIYLLNQWLNKDDKDKDEFWNYMGELGLLHKIVDFGEQLHGGTTTDRVHTGAKVLNEMVSVSPATNEFFDIVNNRNSFNGKEIFHAQDSWIDKSTKLFSYMGSGGNLYTAFGYMSSKDMKGMERGLASLLTPQYFKTYSPNEQMYVENIWAYSDKYKDELEDIRKVLNSDTTTDATVIKLNQQYLDLLRESSGFTDEFMEKKIPPIMADIIGNPIPVTTPLTAKIENESLNDQQQVIDDDKQRMSDLQKMTLLSPAQQEELKGLPAEIKRQEQMLESLRQHKDSLAYNFWNEKLQIAKQVHHDRDSIFDALRNDSDDRQDLIELIDEQLEENKELKSDIRTK